MESLVVTVIGKDRPGLVESVSAAIEAQGGSWVESRMSRLAGQFAGILRASVPEAGVEALSDALEALRSDGLRVVVERGVEDTVEVGSVILLDLIGRWSALVRRYLVQGDGQASRAEEPRPRSASRKPRGDRR